MTDAVDTAPHVPLGVGAVLGDSFSILFRRLPAVALLGFIPALIDVILNNAVGLDSAANLEPGADFDTGGFAFAFGIVFLVSLVMMSVITATLVQLSYDTKLGRPTQLVKYLSTAIKNLPAIVVLSIVASILYVIGSLFLIIPGIWLYAVFSMLVPVIVIEGAGFGALGRSAELTKGYRWPIIGAFILVFLCLFLFGFVTAFILAIFSSGNFFGLGVLLETIINAISYGLASIAVAIIFARLKEIKEGVSVSDLVDVFK
ncbi:hypothetical protein [Ruegeria meonggei]|uniref:hypothetical protein n=1 Tax=Ruegeria meonggei TaxID=1446476 RepID=UPI00366FE078